MSAGPHPPEQRRASSGSDLGNRDGPAVLSPATRASVALGERHVAALDTAHDRRE